MLETESGTDVVSELQQQSWAYSEAVVYALGSHARSKELDFLQVPSNLRYSVSLESSKASQIPKH